MSGVDFFVHYFCLPSEITMKMRLVFYVVVGPIEYKSDVEYDISKVGYERTLLHTGLV